MKKKIKISAVCMLLPLMLSAQSTMVKILTDNINRMTLQQKVDTKALVKDFIDISEYGSNNDAMLLQLYLEVNIPDDNVEKYLSTQRADGSWPDIDYQDQKRGGWVPSNHATRLQALAKVYKTPHTRYYMSPALSSVIHCAMDFWFKSKLKCPNWWYNQIGIPRLLGPAFLLLKDEMSDDEIDSALEVMNHSGFGMTGQNKVWLAGNVLMKALLTDDARLAELARDNIVSEVFISSAEGVQPDFSFHQHGPQMQLGNYGLAYLGSISYWARVFQSTSLALDDKQVALMHGLFVNGMQWPVWRGYFDVNASGRQVFLNAQKGKAHSVAVSAVNMMMVDSVSSIAYKDFIYRNQVCPSAANSLVGNNYFWRSDYSVHRERGWFSSVRMSSARTIGFEMVNRENLKGAFSADGVMITMVDGDEYNNIYPVWDWKRLPGLTVADDHQPIKYYPQAHPVNKSDFVGGVSDGSYGISTMVLNRYAIAAKKSYFFSDEAVVCLGAALKSTNRFPLYTTIDQRCLPAADVCGKSDGKSFTLGKEKRFHAQHIQWLHAGKTGYAMLSPMDVDVSTCTQSGSWHEIAVMYAENQTASMPVFQAVIHHPDSMDGSYAYCVVPDVTSGDMDHHYRNMCKDIQVVNTSAMQAVHFLKKKMWQMVFFKPGTYPLSYRRMRVEVAQPCAMMVRKIGKSFVISLSDPTQKLDRIQFRIYRSDKLLQTFDVDMPSGPNSGSTLSETFPLK